MDPLKTARVALLKTRRALTSLDSTLSPLAGLRVFYPVLKVGRMKQRSPNQNYASEQTSPRRPMKLPLSSGEDKYLRTTRRLRGPN